MSLAKNILLFGATGNIGSFILDAILPERSQFGRIAIFTSPHTAETKVSQLNKLKEQGVEVIVGNVEDENAVKAAYKGTKPFLRTMISMHNNSMTFPKYQAAQITKAKTNH